MNYPTIFIDSRESDKEIRGLFNNQNDFEVKIEKLDRGDIIFGDNIAIERKSVNDFISSISSPTFFEKLFDLKNHYKQTYLWVDGDDYDWRKF